MIDVKFKKTIAAKLKERKIGYSWALHKWGQFTKNEWNQNVGMIFEK